MSKSKNLIFFGNERLSSGFAPHGAPVLQTLIDHGYDVSALVVNYEPGRSRAARQLEVQTVAEQHGIRVLAPKKLRDIASQLAELHPTIGVLAAYGRIVPQDIIDMFPCGILNIHPSLLPEYRGPTPIEQAILDGAHVTGVSIMKLAKEMDAGPLYAQQRVRLTGRESKQQLTQQLITIGARLIARVLPGVLDGSRQATPQGSAKATYTRLISKSDGALDTNKSAEQLEREIRAYAIWPKSHACLLRHDVIVIKARVAKDKHDGILLLECNPGWLEVQQLIGPSGKTMTGEQFLRGYAKN